MRPLRLWVVQLRNGVYSPVYPLRAQLCFGPYHPETTLRPNSFSIAIDRVSSFFYPLETL